MKLKFRITAFKVYVSLIEMQISVWDTDTLISKFNTDVCILDTHSCFSIRDICIYD